MASSAADHWTVLIISDDTKLNRTYTLSPDITLDDVMQIWKDEHQLSSHWITLSADQQARYEDGSITLREIGETVPGAKLVTLQVRISDQSPPNPFIEISLFIKGQLFDLCVRQSDKLLNVLPRVSGSRARYEYNGRPLCLSKTVRQAKLKDKAVIYSCDSFCRVAVRLTSGVTKSIALPPDALTSHLQYKVAAFEKEGFSLKYLGRPLSPQMPVKELKHPVEVCTTNFVVHLNNRLIRWNTASGAIGFREFIFQLSVNGNLQNQELEIANFRCVGCGRRICKSEEEFQQIEIPCCREMSRTLKAELPNQTKTVPRSVTDFRGQTAKPLKIAAKSPRTSVKSQTGGIVLEDQAIQSVIKEIKLMVFYWPHQFMPNVTHFGIDKQAKYQWCEWSHIKCRVVIPDPVDGWVDLDDLRASLNPLFIEGNEIQMIEQWRGVNGDTVVARVTSNSDDEERKDQRRQEYCDNKGIQFSEAKAKPRREYVRSGGSVLICGNQRRTILRIFNN